MKRNTGILSILGMLLITTLPNLMVGCSEDVIKQDSELLSEEDIDGMPVIVEADIISPSTRGVFFKKGLYNTFSVFGIYNENVRWNNILQVQDSLGNWVAQTNMLWPNGSVNAYALLPSGNVKGLSNIVMAGKRVGLKMVPPEYRSFDFEVQDSNKHQVDIMFASTMNVSQFDNDGKISFTFRHSLAFMGFQIADKMQDLDITVKSVTLHNVLTTGTFRFSNDKTQKSVGEWVISNDHWGKITQEFGSPVHLTYKKTAFGYTYTDCSGDSLLMIMPKQTTKVWAKRGGLDENKLQHYESIADADVNHNGYYELNCQLKKTVDNVDYWLVRTVDTTTPANSKWEWKTEPTWTHVYLPGKAQTWNQATTYKIKIDFPIFYDENGDPIAEYPDVVLDTNVDFDSLITVEEEWSEDADNSQTINFSTL